MTTPARPDANDDAAARYWLAVLGDANADERMAAREQLVANVQDGAMTVELLDRLNRLNCARGTGR